MSSLEWTVCLTRLPEGCWEGGWHLLRGLSADRVRTCSPGGAEPPPPWAASTWALWMVSPRSHRQEQKVSIP